MNTCEDAPAIAQGRELQEASPALIFLQFCASGHEVGTVFKNGLSTLKFNFQFLLETSGQKREEWLIVFRP